MPELPEERECARTLLIVETETTLVKLIRYLKALGYDEDSAVEIFRGRWSVEEK